MFIKVTQRYEGCMKEWRKCLLLFEDPDVRELFFDFIVRMVCNYG